MKISSVKGIREEEVERTIPEGIAEEVNQVAGIISKPRYFLGGRGCEDSRKKKQAAGKKFLEITSSI